MLYINSLRVLEDDLNTPPFDGLDGLVTWLGLSDPFQSSNSTAISLRVLPPVVITSCELLDNALSIALNAHSKFDHSKVSVAVFPFPGAGLSARQQVSSDFAWARAKSGIRSAEAQVDLDNADSVLVILLAGASMVARQWFLDPSKARNGRLLAVREFDKDLRMIRRAVLMQKDNSDAFEKGVSALLFLLGFSSMIPVERDAPDLVVMTPRGTIVLIECTYKITDFASKVGKLIHRKQSLLKSLEASGHHSRVEACLVCALPRESIGVDVEMLVRHKIVLITSEQLEVSFDRVHVVSDPDKLLEDALAQLNNYATRELPFHN
ncbi:hypothetical protein F3F93_06745 [Mariprofundus sp. KV]|nr:hypothetical protein [Mariprofundus sp. KV]